MAVGVRSASAPARVSGGSIVVAKPPGLQVGDTLFGIHHSHTDSLTAVEPPAGFTRTNHEGGSSSRGLYVLSYKSATSEDVAADDFEFAADDRGVAGLLALTGIEDSTLAAMIATPETFTTSSSSSQAAPSVSPAGSGCLLICGFHCFTSSGTPNYSVPPSGMTTHWNLAADASTNLATLAATEVLASSGATGTRPVTTNPTATNWLAWSIALNPAPEPPPSVGDPSSFFPFFG